MRRITRRAGSSRRPQQTACQQHPTNAPMTRANAARAAMYGQLGPVGHRGGGAWAGRGAGDGQDQPQQLSFRPGSRTPGPGTAPVTPRHPRRQQREAPAMCVGRARQFSNLRYRTKRNSSNRKADRNFKVSRVAHKPGSSGNS